MTTQARACDNILAHPAHFYADGGILSCPGVDPEPLPGEQDRPNAVVQGETWGHLDEFDWTPEVLHLTNAAAIVVRLHQARTDSGSGVLLARYTGAMAVWQELTGMDEPTALTYAYSIATLTTPATATPIPF